MPKTKIILNFKAGDVNHYVENLSNLHSNHLMIPIENVQWNEVGEPTGFTITEVGEPTAEDLVIGIEVGEPTLVGNIVVRQ